MIKIVNFVTEPEVVAMLNLEPPGPSTYADFIEKYWNGVDSEAPWDPASPFASWLREWVDVEAETGRAAFAKNDLASAPCFKPPACPPGTGWSLPVTISLEESWLIGDALASAHLRSLVDAWLETGRDPNGTECPADRNILKASWAWNCLEEYAEQCLITMRPSPDPSGFRLMIAAPEWAHPWAGDFFEAQWVRAKRLFVGIMAGDWSQRLCKCRYAPCGRYFTGAKLRKSYRHGTFCSHEHLAHASADAITKARRFKGRHDLIDTSAQWLGKQNNASGWPDDKALKRQLAAFLSKQLRGNPTLRDGRSPVTVKWVTRNQALIEQRRQTAVAN